MNPTISVIGTGYLGATHAAGMAELGFEVIGVDTDQSRIRSLSVGEVPFFEPGLPELLKRHVDSGRLKFTTDLSRAAEVADVHFVCVGTPEGPTGAADLTALHAVIDDLVPRLKRSSLIVGKSTVPVGTAEELLRRIDNLAPAGLCVDLAWNPEFLREGHGVHDTLHPDRLVFGVACPSTELLLRDIYATPISRGCPVVVTNLATSELVKVAANAFLATKISFINSMAELSQVTGADVVGLSKALGYDERIGHRFLGAGLGYGGGCLPKDVRALLARADELGQGEAVDFLRGVERVNELRRTRVVNEAMSVTGSGGRAAVLGAAFKPHSDDVRDSPALDVARRLHSSGVMVTVHDPQASLRARELAPELRYVANPQAACRKADVVLHLTEWPEYAQLDPAELAQTARGRVLIDARNCLDPAPWLAVGWDVRTLGSLVPAAELSSYGTQKPRKPRKPRKQSLVS